MSLMLHDTYGFTAACAVDGSFMPRRDDAADGRAAWAVWYGVDDDGQTHGEGGALEDGATIADGDAELAAIDACMERVDERHGQRDAAPVLLVVSDCTAVMQGLQTACGRREPRGD